MDNTARQPRNGRVQGMAVCSVAMPWNASPPNASLLFSPIFLSRHLPPNHRHIQLKMLPSKTLNFSIQFLKTAFTYEISPDGKLVRTLQKESNGYQFDPIALKSSVKSHAAEYIRKHQPRNERAVFYGHHLTSYGEILLVRDRKAKGLDILNFDDPVQ